MNPHYFLFAIAFVWTIFAAVQDIKKREIANWLNFSLIAFALAFRAFVSIQDNSPKFFLFGIIGFAIFFVLANAFYYSKVFAGGDAKLLMAYGIILPYNNYSDFYLLPLLFVFALFAIGAILGIVYSIFIANKNKKIFKKEFKKACKKYKVLLIASSSIILVVALAIAKNYLLAMLTVLPTLLIYTKSVEKCMIKRVSPEKLTEGDWLETEVTYKNRKIEKSVHGLSLEEIAFLKKHKIKVLIKEGMPFAPAFLFALVFMVYAYLVFGLEVVAFFS